MALVTDCRPGTRWYKARAGLAVFGGFLVHLSLGTLYTFGNMNPYYTSYIRAYSSPSDLKYADSVWVFGITAAFQGFAMFVGGILNGKFGPRITVLIGSIILSTGTILTGLTIKYSFYYTLFTYGFMVGIGTGIAYAPPMACAMKWLPDYKGLVNGIVVAGFGGGAFIFDQVQTAFINPENLSPDSADQGERYFTPEKAASLLERVPKCYFLLGGCYASLQLVGSLLLADPPVYEQWEEESASLVDDAGEDNDIVSSGSQGQPSLHPLKVIRTRAFWTLWVTFLGNGIAVLFISTLYKTYGENFIHDDHFLALLGSFASVGNSLGRIGWGKMVDRFSYKICMCCVCGVMTIMMATLLATPYGGKAMFFIWICVIFLTFSGNFALFPTVTARAFGPKYVAINFGLVFSSQGVTGLVGSVLTTTLNSILGWSGMFFLVAGISLFTLLLTMSFNVKTEAGRDI